MPTVPLPDDPSLEQLRKQAKDLRDLARAGLPGALELVAAHHPQGAHAVTLTGAQFVVARHYGFASWPRLKQHIEMIERYRRAPDEVDETTSLTDEFLALACLRYGGDDAADRWERAARLLAEHPALARTSVHVAAAAADAAAVRAHLAADPALASREGGPYGWAPILYLAYARHDPRLSAAAVLGTARALLDHGADPNAGYLWHGLYPPSTALTGALGNGEGGQPQHPHGFALASLLLEAGADANDGQALYNRQFGDDDRHLALLFEHGLGQGDGGPWRARFGHTADSPQDMLRGQLWWAIVHDMRARARLLVEHGADFLTPYAAPGGRPTGLRTSHGKTPAEVAALSGCTEMVSWLVAQGADPPAFTGPDALIAALMAGDQDAVAGLREHTEEARAKRPGLVVWAAARRKREAVELLAEVGFDVNAKGRGDIPAEDQWETALHEAASSGDLELARVLLRLGADPNSKDARFDATPLGWARYFEQQAMIGLLEPLTS
ncbi:MAG TPA: ankyrin repeat domain-containing protein [Trebonia sp.]